MKQGIFSKIHLILIINTDNFVLPKIKKLNFGKHASCKNILTKKKDLKLRLSSLAWYGWYLNLLPDRLQGGIHHKKTCEISRFLWRKPVWKTWECFPLTFKLLMPSTKQMSWSKYFHKLPYFSELLKRVTKFCEECFYILAHFLLL